MIEYHYCIWIHRKECSQKSTNIPNIGLLILVKGFEIVIILRRPKSVCGVKLMGCLLNVNNNASSAHNPKMKDDIQVVFLFPAGIPSCRASCRGISSIACSYFTQSFLANLLGQSPVYPVAIFDCLML